MKRKQKRHFVIGDIHGELNGLKEILKHAKVIDCDDNWSGRDIVLVQTGDVIDRGPHSIECVALLRKLQQQATQAREGKVVRLCGNHELWLLQGKFKYANFHHPEVLTEELKAEISRGQVTAAYTDGRRLFTHAGLRSRLREELMSGIAPDELPVAPGDIDLRVLVEHLNELFRGCVKSRQLHHHPIFYVGAERGGSDPFGGIFWGDYSQISESEGAWEIPQVFGHTPSRKDKVQHNWNLTLINVDAGMCDHYGGFHVYLEIDPKGNVIEHSKTKRGTWKKTVLDS